MELWTDSDVIDLILVADVGCRCLMWAHTVQVDWFGGSMEVIVFIGYILVATICVHC